MNKHCIISQKQVKNEKIQAPIKDKRHAEMTDWARHQQSAQMTTQNLQATLQDLLYNNYEPITNLSFSHLTISHTTEKGTRQIWVTHVKLYKTISYVEQALSCYVPYFLLSNNTKCMHYALHTILQTQCSLFE